MQTRNKTTERVTTLIDAASAKVGSDNRLSQAIGSSRGTLSAWKNGHTPCPLEAQVLMAEIAGMNPSEVLAYAIIEREPNERRKELLAHALGKALERYGEAACLALSVSAVLASTDSSSYLIRCIERLSGVDTNLTGR